MRRVPYLQLVDFDHAPYIKEYEELSIALEKVHLNLLTFLNSISYIETNTETAIILSNIVTELFRTLGEIAIFITEYKFDKLMNKQNSTLLRRTRF